MKRAKYLLLMLIGALLFAAPIAAQAQLMTRQNDRAYRAMLPKIADAELTKIFADPATLIYTEAEVPKAYQKWQIDGNDGGPTGVHWVDFNMSMDPGEQEKGHGNGGNGNTEFPWRRTAGFDRDTPAETWKFISLPKDASGRKQPIVYWTEKLNSQMTSGVTWCFPQGAVVGEVLYQIGPDGRAYVFEIRTRVRVKTGWAPDVYRPFPLARDLAHRIIEIRPLWRASRGLAGLVHGLLEPRPQLRPFRLIDVQHRTRRVFDATAVEDELPAMDPKLVAELLVTTPFQSCLTGEWRSSADGRSCFAPTSAGEFGIVPKNYRAAAVEMTQQSCTRCHETTNRHVKDFDQQRTWYGRIRGADGIFSFHPFDPSCIAPAGQTLPVRYRPELLHAGYIAPFDGSRHTAARYLRSREE